MLSRVRLAAPVAAAGDSRAAETRARRSRRRQRSSARMRQPGLPLAAPSPRLAAASGRCGAGGARPGSAHPGKRERNGLPSPHTDREREPRVPAGVCVSGLPVVICIDTSCPRIGPSPQSGDRPSACSSDASGAVQEAEKEA